MKKPTLNSQPKNRRFRNIAAATCLIIFLAPSVQALADIPPIKSPDSSSLIIEAIDKVREEMIARMELARTQINELFLNAYDKFTGNAQQPNLATQNPANAYQFVVGDNKNEQKPLPVYDLVKESAQKAALKKLQTSISPGNVEAQRQILLQPPSNDKDAIANMLDAQSLLGPLSYTPAAQNAAERAVEFLSDYATPLGTIDLQKLREQKPDLDKSRSAQEYKVKVYTQGAIRSLLLGNLYDSLEQRVPVKNLGKVSGMPNKTDASLAEVLKYIASRRISDPKWYETMNTASPIVVQREIAFILSELQWQLYQLHTDNERILQTITAAGVVNLRAGVVLPDKNTMELQAAFEGTMPKTPTAGGEPDTKYDLPPTTPNSNNTLPSIP